MLKRKEKGWKGFTCFWVALTECKNKEGWNLLRTWEIKLLMTTFAKIHLGQSVIFNKGLVLIKKFQSFVKI